MGSRKDIANRFDKQRTNPKALYPVGDESDLARALSFWLEIDAEVLTNDGAVPKEQQPEQDAVRERVKRVWAAYHGASTDLVERKRRAIVAALDYVLENETLRVASWAVRCSCVRHHLRRIDQPRAESLGAAAITAALKSWPPKLGRPPKAQRPRASDEDESTNTSTDWDRISPLFEAFGCGNRDGGQALRVELHKQRIYSMKKTRRRLDTD